MTQHQVKELAKSYPPPQADKLEKRLGQIERMSGFYRDKIQTAPEKQSIMFKGFVGALLYASDMIKMYRRLTKKLEKLAEDNEK